MHAESSWHGHPQRILLVDRDADTRSLYTEFLKIFEWEVDEAADGREALAKAISGRPDIIVTETRLPGLNGFDLCRLLRSDESTREIPIVVVTGDAFADDIRRAEQAGADTVLVKPCLPETLRLEMERLLRTSASLLERGSAARMKIDAETRRSVRLVEEARACRQRLTLSRAHARGSTTTPPLPPPQLVCPGCDYPLRYVRSQIGGVSVRHIEQWDYFECPAGCGTFHYRQRTRKLRKMS